MTNFDRFLKLTNQYSNSLYKLSERKTSDISDLEQYVDQNYAVHFSDLPKLGINPQTEFTTPVAVCGYPLTKEIYNKIINNSIPYAQDKKYMHLYKVNGAFNVDNYDELKLKEDLEKILELVKQNKEWQKKIHYNESDSDEENINKLIALSRIDNSKTPIAFGTMRILTEKLSNNVSKWNALLQYLGYKAIVDTKYGVLWAGNSNGPGPQVQVYDRSVIEYIKYYTPPARYKEEQKSTYKKLEENLTKKLKSNQDIKNIELLKKFLSHENPDLKESAEKAAVNTITDQEILFQIAFNNQDLRTRKKAIDKITNQEKLKELALREDSLKREDCAKVLSKIFEKITDQKILQELFDSSDSYYIKGFATQNFINPNQLKEIALNDSNTSTSIEATLRIIELSRMQSDDSQYQDLLIEIYNKTKQLRIQSEIIFAIKDREILNKAIKHPSEDVRYNLVERIGNDYEGTIDNAQEILEQVVEDDSDLVKENAANYIINPEVLKKLYLKNSTNDSLVLNILNNDNFNDLNVSKDIAINSKNSDLRMAAIDRISNKKILKEILIAYEQKEGYYGEEQDRIFEESNFGNEFNKWIAENSKNDSLREMALSKMALSKKARSNKIAQLSKTVNLFYKTIKAISK